MNLLVRYALILLSLYLPQSGVYADLAQKNLGIEHLFKPATLGKNLTDGNSVAYTFSGSTADYINYVRLCQATDNTCSSCGAPYATYNILTSSNGMPYSMGGTTHLLLASGIQTYLINNGYADGTYYIGLYVQSQGLACNTNQSYCSTNQDNAGHVLCVQALLSGGTTTLTREDNGVAVLSSNTTPYLYVNNSTPNTTSVCPAYASPFACTTSGNIGLSPSSPYGIAIDPPSQNVYVMSRGSTANSLSCSINSSNGSLSCSILSFAANLASKTCTAQGIAIDPPGQNAYVTRNNNKIFKCALGGNSCNQLTLPSVTLNNPTGIVIDPTNSYMYIANTGGSNLVACSIGGVTCATGNSGNPTAYVAIDNTGKYVYTGKSTGSSVYSCNVTGTSFNSCPITNSGTTTIRGIALNPSGSKAYIAVQGGSGQINSCPTAPGGGISSSCINTSSTGTTTSMQGIAWANVVGP